MQHRVVAVEGLDGLGFNSLCRERERESKEDLVLEERRERKIEMKRHAQNINRIENGRIKKSLFCFVVKHLSTQHKFWLL
jgi:hypothetical protein